MALSALSLPGELQRFMDRALRGELEIRFRNLDENVRVLYSVGQQLLWGMLGATAAVMSAVFSGRGQGGASLLSGLLAGVFAVFLLFAWFGGRPRRWCRQRLRPVTRRPPSHDRNSITPKKPPAIAAIKRAVCCSRPSKTTASTDAVAPSMPHRSCCPAW